MSLPKQLKEINESIVVNMFFFSRKEILTHVPGVIVKCFIYNAKDRWKITVDHYENLNEY